MGLVSAVVIACTPVTVMAADTMNTITCVEGQAERTTYLDSNIQLIDLPEVVGETNVVKQDENGVLTVTLLHSEESVTRGTNRTSKKNYGFQYTNIFGQKLTAFNVYLSCDWVIDGVNTKIDVLNGSFEEVGGGYKCEWVDSRYTEVYCELFLDVTKAGTGTGTYVFGASVVPDPGNEQNNFGYAFWG